MHIGLTYDLRQEYLSMCYSEDETAEFDRPDTIDALEKTLRGLGHETERIGAVRALTARLAAGGHWDLVFNICEGLTGFAREAQVPALLEAFDIPYTFSDPLVLSLSLHKGMTKRILRDLGIPTPSFAEVHTPQEADSIDLPWPLFAKPMAEGTGKGISSSSFIDNRPALRAVCSALLEQYHQPVLVETYLPGREFTVGITGTGSKARAVGTVEVRLRAQAEQHAYSYENKERCEELVDYVPVQDAEASQAAATALAAWRGLGCRDAGRVDLRSDAGGTVNVIELNPLAGLHPEHSDLPIICTACGLSYAWLLEAILTSAAERM